MKIYATPLRAKWRPFQPDAFVWIMCRRRIEQEQTTGNWSPAKCLAMVHALYIGQGGTLIDDKKGRRRFKYVEAAEYLSRYLKLMDMSNEHSTKVSDDVRCAIYGDLSGNAERKHDGVETGTKSSDRRREEGSGEEQDK